jgi:hypothetical protein
MGGKRETLILCIYSRDTRRFRETGARTSGMKEGRNGTEG